MEEYYSPLCSTYLCQDEGIEEVRHCVLYISELEATIVAIKEEIRRREVEIANVKVIINNTIKERNEAEQQSKTLLVEKIMLQQKIHKKEQPMQPHPLPPPLAAAAADEALDEMVVKMGGEKALPEKGKLLQAVKEAGPLLQTLALAGPLPQWQHPPPPPPPIAGDSFSPTNYPNVSFFTR